MQLWGSFGLITNNGNFILQQRNDPSPLFDKKWAMPGGIIQFGEHPEDTLYRRCQEELGIKIEIIRLIPIIQSYIVEGTEQQLLLIHYLAKTNAKKVENLDTHNDIRQVRWFKLKDYKRIDLIRGNKQVIEEVVKNYEI